MIIKKKKSKVSKGNYYKYKTKRWFKDEGYFCDYLEKTQRIYSAGKVFFIHKDLAGADGFAMKKDQMIFWQCKLNKKNIAEAIKEFQKYPFPPFIDRWVIVWQKGQSVPDIVEVFDESSSESPKQPGKSSSNES